MYKFFKDNDSSPDSIQRLRQHTAKLLSSSKTLSLENSDPGVSDRGPGVMWQRCISIGCGKERHRDDAEGQECTDCPLLLFHYVDLR